MAKVAFVSVLALAFAVSTGSALAAKKSFYLNPPDLTESSATEVFNGVQLGPNAPGSVVVNITLPGDYKRNSEVVLRARMLTGDTNCDVEFMASGTYRYRPGSVGQNLGDPESGLSVSGATVVTVPSTGSQVFTKVFKLNKPTSGPSSISRRAIQFRPSSRAMARAGPMIVRLRCWSIQSRSLTKPTRFPRRGRHFTMAAKPGPCQQAG